MTEAEWAASNDVWAMFSFLRGKASDRKLRLFVCASSRAIWDLLSPDQRRAIEVGEQFADGFATDGERHSAFVQLMVTGGATRFAAPAHFSMHWATPALVTAGIACASGTESLMCSLNGRAETGLAEGGDWIYRAMAVGEQLYWALYFANIQRQYEQRQSYGRIRRALATLMHNWSPHKSLQSVWLAVSRRQLVLIRDLFGRHPSQPIAFDVGWRTDTVVALAQGIYDDRAFDRLPILADALEDAGCADAAILGHCRQPGEHVRGCWLVDLVLGKE